MEDRCCWVFIIVYHNAQVVVGNLEERGEMAEVEANYNDDNLQGVFSCITFTSMEQFSFFVRGH